MTSAHTKKTIADIAADHLKETNNNAVMWGDCFLLDEIASKCDHTNLMTLHPLTRHHRIFNSLEKSKLFEKGYVRITGFRGFSLVRVFKLKPYQEDDNETV